MPPKKKKGKGKKKKKKDGMTGLIVFSLFFVKNVFDVQGNFELFVCCFCAEKTELTIEDKYKRTMQEIEVLKDELGRFFKIKIF